MVNDLTRGSPTKLIIMFSLSMLASSMMGYVYSTTDSMMVSWFIAPDALGAISAASPAIGLIDGFAGAAVGGFSILAGRVFGSGDIKRLKNIMANVVYLSIAFIGAATLICTVFCRQLVLLMNTPDGFVDMATAYFFVEMMGMPIAGICWVCGGMFRALGDSKTPLLISGICGFLNVVFNAFFLGIVGMGIEGAACGTVCANVVGAAMYLIFLKKRMSVLLFGREDSSISFPTMRILLSNGIPLGLLNAVITVGAIVLQVAVNSHGENVVNGIAVGNRVLMFLWMFFQTFESAIVYFCAQNIGAGQIDRVRRGVRNTLLINFGIGAVATVLALCFGKYIYMMFVGDSPEIIAVAEQYLLAQVVFFPLMVTLCIWRGGLNGLGSTVPAVMCGVIELISRMIISFCFADNLMILYFAGPLAWVGASVFLAILYPRTLKKREREFEAAKAAKEAEGALDAREEYGELLSQE